MARPIRDFQTETARSGDATRAYGRFGDGSDWLQAGITAMERAGNEIGRVISERVEQANRLEDATVRSEAIQRTRLRLDERLRGLDPRAPEYSSEVERVLSETIQSVVSETNWRRSSTREQFLLDAAQLRTQALLSAADQREKAVVNAAKEQVDTALGRAVAAIAQAPGTRDVQLLQLENEIGPILANIRPEVRDAIIKQVREVTAEEAVRNFIISRNFAAAEQALRVYGGQGLISPTAVRQIRAGLQAEKRQAAAEARAATELAVNRVRALFIDGFVDEGRQALQEALRSGVIAPGSMNHKVLDAMAGEAQRRQRDRGAEAFNQAVAKIDSGGGTRDDEAAIWNYFAEVVKGRLLEKYGPNVMASPESAADVEREARQTAQERAIEFIIDRRPHQAPRLLRDMVGAGARDPSRRGVVGAFLERLRQRNPGIVEEVLREDPRLAVTMDAMRAAGEPITASLLGAKFSGPPLQPRPEAEWNTQIRENALKPEEDLQRAARRLIPDEGLRNALLSRQMGQLREDYRRAWLTGEDGETASFFAVQRALGDLYPSRASTQPVWLRRENAPAAHFRADLFPEIKPDVFERQVFKRAVGAVVEAMRAENANITEKEVLDQYDIFVTATEVSVYGQPRWAFVVHRQHKTPGAPMVPVEVRRGQLWQWIVPEGRPEDVRKAFDDAFKLDEALNIMRQNPGGGSVEDIQRRQQIQEQAREGTEEFRRMDRIIRGVQEREGTLITPGPAQRR